MGICSDKSPLLFSPYPASHGCCCCLFCARETSSPCSSWCGMQCRGTAWTGCSRPWSKIPTWIPGCRHWGICSGRDQGQRRASHLALPCLPHASSSLGACARKLPRRNQRGKENRTGASASSLAPLILCLKVGSARKRQRTAWSWTVRERGRGCCWRRWHLSPWGPRNVGMWQGWKRRCPWSLQGTHLLRAQIRLLRTAPSRMQLGSSGRFPRQSWQRRSSPLSRYWAGFAVPFQPVSLYSLIPIPSSHFPQVHGQRLKMLLLQESSVSGCFCLSPGADALNRLMPGPRKG